MAGVGHTKLPADMTWATQTDPVWCRSPRDVLGGESESLAIALAACGFALVGASLVRGDAARSLARASAIVAAPSAIVCAAVAAVVRLHTSPLLHVFTGARWKWMGAIAGVAWLVGAALVVRARRRGAGPLGAIAGGLVPLAAGAAIAEHTRAHAARALGWFWSTLPFDVRARMLAETVDDVGIPFVLGLGASASLLAGAALLARDRERPLPRGAVLAIAAALATRALFGAAFDARIAVAGVLVSVLVLFARGAPRSLLTSAVLAIDVFTVLGGARERFGKIASESWWGDRFVVVDLTARALVVLAVVAAADVALVFLVSRGRREAARASGLVEAVVAAALLFAMTPLLRVGVLVARVARSSAELTAKAAEVGVPIVRAVDGGPLRAYVVASAGDGLVGAYVDDGEPWAPATPRPEVLRTDAVTAILPASMTIAEASTRLGRIADLHTRAFVLVRTPDETYGPLRSAFVAPPLHTIPIVFGVADEDLVNRPYTPSDVIVHPRGETAEVHTPAFRPETVPLSALADAVGKRCYNPSSYGAPNTGLLVLDAPPTTTLGELVALAETAIPGLELAEWSPRKCAFRAIAIPRRAR